MTYEPLDENLSNELREYANQNEFKHIIHLLALLVLNEEPVLSEFDREQLWLFANYIKITSSLQYPYWNDDLDNYDEADGDGYLEVINGLYSNFSSWLYDELNLAVGDSK
jgi:hypothetical protein